MTVPPNANANPVADASRQPNTAPHDLSIARAVLLEAHDDRVVLGFADLDYQVHLLVERKPATPEGKRILGVIRAQARRIDVVGSGGRYVEPVYGRPTRVQGKVVDADPEARTVTVHAGFPMVLTLDTGQTPGSVNVGDFITCATLPGATFTPTSD